MKYVPLLSHTTLTAKLSYTVKKKKTEKKQYISPVCTDRFKYLIVRDKQKNRQIETNRDPKHFCMRIMVHGPHFILKETVQKASCFNKK